MKGYKGYVFFFCSGIGGKVLLATGKAEEIKSSACVPLPG